MNYYMGISNGGFCFVVVWYKMFSTRRTWMAVRLQKYHVDRYERVPLLTLDRFHSTTFCTLLCAAPLLGNAFQAMKFIYMIWNPDSNTYLYYVNWAMWSASSIGYFQIQRAVGKMFHFTFNVLYSN